MHVLCVYIGATAVGGGFFTEFSLPAVATNFRCSGNETHLYDCPHALTPATDCVHDAAVICQGTYIVCMHDSGLVAMIARQ